MNPDHKDKRLPKVMGQGFNNLFPEEADPQAVTLVSQMLQYDPNNRIGLYQAMASPFFHELRDEELSLPNGNCIPDLFSFSPQEK